MQVHQARGTKERAFLSAEPDARSTLGSMGDAASGAESEEPVLDARMRWPAPEQGSKTGGGGGSGVIWY
jgi:hypothetical protein